MHQYTQLTVAERVRIFDLYRQKASIRFIANAIGRDKSTISRELQRNSDHYGYLRPEEAQRKSKKRKAHHGSKIDRDSELRTYVIENLKQRWSPVIIAGRWTKEHPTRSISAEAIYQFIYSNKNKELKLWNFLLRRKHTRGTVRKKRSKGGILHRVPIHERPKEVNERKEFGHFEADLFLNEGSQSKNVLTIVERKSRMVILIKHNSKHSKPIIQSIKDKIGLFALSCTFDNGKEFAEHHTLGINTYFCDPASPWQKGSVENMNAVVREFCPFSMNPDLITQEYLDMVANKLNNKPRKILNFLTPHEAFLNSFPQQESRVKIAQPAIEVSFNQNLISVALHS